MFRAFQDFFDSITAVPPDQTPQGRAQALRLAAAVLLVEVMRADANVGPAERQAVLAALRTRFTLSADELAGLVELAEAQSRNASDYFRFTSRINDNFSQPDKIALVQAMWDVAYADGLLDANENHVISKVADLLHVTHGEYIAAKMRAKETAGLA
ncbi:MAG: TerB family tellurite resistance protein [Ramlibacter sp.]